jgi:hypothetical protein
MSKTRKPATSPALAPLRAAFVARATQAVESWSLRLSGRELALAVAEPRNELVVLHALQRPEAWAGVLDHDPLAAAKARGVEKQRDLLAAEGGAAGVDELASALHISRQAVDKRRRAGKLLALPRGGHRWVFPAWQVARGRTVPGLEEVLATLGGRDPWSQLIFFVTPDRLLDNRSPLQALRAGDLAAVVRAAEGYGEQGLA